MPRDTLRAPSQNFKTRPSDAGNPVTNLHDTRVHVDIRNTSSHGDTTMISKTLKASRDCRRRCRRHRAGRLRLSAHRLSGADRKPDQQRHRRRARPGLQPDRRQPARPDVQRRQRRLLHRLPAGRRDYRFAGALRLRLHGSRPVAPRRERPRSSPPTATTTTIPAFNFRAPYTGAYRVTLEMVRCRAYRCQVGAVVLGNTI